MTRNYGWVVVAAGAIITCVAMGAMFALPVYLQPMAEDTGWTMYMERALGNGWRLRAEATDLFGRKFTETRVKYADRANGVVDETEQRRRLSPGTVSLSFRWSAGD